MRRPYAIVSPSGQVPEDVQPRVIRLLSAIFIHVHGSRKYDEEFRILDKARSGSKIQADGSQVSFKTKYTRWINY